jgi:hypothetical protein
MSNWYIEVRTPRRSEPARNQAKGGSIATTYDAEKLAQYRLRIAKEDALEQEIEVTPELEATWLADIRVAVAEFIASQS